MIPDSKSGGLSKTPYFRKEMNQNQISRRFFEGKSVLVCGGAGFMGSNLILALLQTGAKIRATYHIKKPQIKNQKIEYIKSDLTRSQDCKRVSSDVNFVFMCAANSSGAAVIEKSPLVHVTPNVIMNALMLEAAYEAGVEKFLFVSSNTVYPPFTHPVKENEIFAGDPFEKYFPVAWMKRFGEIMCQIYSSKIKNPMKTVVIRPANTYGPFDDFAWETSHVIPALIRKVVERHNPVEVWGDGKEIKDLIYVEDLIGGMLAAMAKINKFLAVNIASGKGVSINTVLKTIIKIEKANNLKIKYNKSMPTMIKKRLLSTGLAREILDFSADTSLANGLKKTINWYKLSTAKKQKTYGNLENSF